MMTYAVETKLPEIEINIPNHMETNEITSLVHLVNKIYDEAEANMWKKKGVRTTVVEIESLIKKERLIVAKEDGIIVGSIKMDQLDHETGEFGMLVVDPAKRGRKLGRTLIEFAEKWAKSRGCTIMQLELLTPRTWDHPTKEFLKRWYTRMGYSPQKTAPFDAEFPDIVNLLACECDFTIWTKCI